MPTDTSDVALARLTVQIEGLTKEIMSLRQAMSDQGNAHADEVESVRAKSDSTNNALIDLRGVLRGGVLVLTFFQAAVFASFFWLFSQVSFEASAIAEIRGDIKHYESQLTQLSRDINKLNVK